MAANIFNFSVLIFSAAVTLVQGVCSSLQKIKRIVWFGLKWFKRMANSSAPQVPIALSLAPGDAIQLCESLGAITIIRSSGYFFPRLSAMILRAMYHGASSAGRAY